jgi:hypothetical protein
MRVRYQTFSLPELARQVQPDGYVALAIGLMAVAALAKSAQVPFHFWLPRAMAAPTPVSAYLHSAAMVAAGVFLLQRLYPLLQRSETLLAILLAIGVTSMTVGGIISLTRDALKQVLAYSTIAQYGYVVTMLGLGAEAGAAGACYYVLAHALAKSALFLTAGSVTEATGEDRLSHLGGLWRSMPLLAVASGLAAAALAGLPLTVGFFKDELFLPRSSGAQLVVRTRCSGWRRVDVGVHLALLEPNLPRHAARGSRNAVCHAGRADCRAGCSGCCGRDCRRTLRHPGFIGGGSGARRPGSDRRGLPRRCTTGEPDGSGDVRGRASGCKSSILGPFGA